MQTSVLMQYVQDSMWRSCVNQGSQKGENIKGVDRIVILLPLDENGPQIFEGLANGQGAVLSCTSKDAYIKGNKC